MRTRQGPVSVPVPHPGARVQLSRLPVHPLAAAAQDTGPPPHDPDATHDLQIGKIFTNMRLAMKVTRDTVARRLATSVFTIEAFETGTLASLPHWRETERIVRGYCDFLRMDPEPILWRLRSHYHASGLPMGLLATPLRPAGSDQAEWPESETAHEDRQDAMPSAFRRTTTQTATSSQPSSRRRRRRRRLLVLTAPVLAVVGGLLAAHSVPGPLYLSLSLLPKQVVTPVRSGVDALVLAMAPAKDGLRWIDVGDPQLRKSDKLLTRQ